MYRRSALILPIILAISGITTFSAETALASKYFSKHYPRARAKARQGLWSEALRIWKSCLEQRDTSRKERAKLLYSMALGLAKTGRRRKAFRYAKKAHAIAPSSKSITKLYKRLRPKSKDFGSQWREAKASFESALQNERMYEGTGSDLFKSASKVFERAISKGYKPAFSHYALGTCLIETNGDRNKARIHLEKSYDLDKENAGLLYRLGEMALEDGEAQSALSHLLDCEKSGSATPQALAALVRAYARAKNKVDHNRVTDLVNRVAMADASLAQGLENEFSDNKLKSRLSKIISTAKSEEDKMASAMRRSARASRSSNSSNNRKAASKTRSSNTAKKKEKTQQEKNNETYNKLRYNQYLRHLGRLQRGEPSSWSGSIPKPPKKD